MAESPSAAIVLAAGKGTRMRSELPKVLHPLLGQPMLTYALQAVAPLCSGPVVVVVGFGHEQVRSAFTNPQFRFVLQSEQLGTGHAALMARPVLEQFDGDVFILPGDAPLLKSETLKAMQAYHKAEGAQLTVLTTSLPDAIHYGRIVRAEDGRLLRIVEAKDADAATRAIREINSGVYLVNARFLFSALARLGNQNAQGEYYLTDIVEMARTAELPLRAFHYDASAELSGVNDRVELAWAEDYMRREIVTRLMRAGVSVEQPDSVRIEPGVQVEPDVSLGVGVQLRGRSRVGRGTRIEPYAVLQDVHIGPGSVVGAHAVLSGLELDARTSVPALTHRVAQGRR